LRSAGCFVTAVVGQFISPTFNRHASKKIRAIRSPEQSVTKQPTLRFFEPCIVNTYVIRTNKMHTFYITVLIQLYCLRHRSNNQVFILRNTCTCSCMVFLSCIHINSLLSTS
jgi:hypothetical protein